jgi:hypothetical protein
VIALLSLVAAWVVAPAAVPIYDGAGQPDEPYRYVDPPSDAKTTLKPTGAHKVLAIIGGVNKDQTYANTEEIAPQFSAYVFPNALKTSPQTTQVDVDVTPKAVAPPLPSDGTIVGNVYSLTLQPDAGTIQVVAPARAAMVLAMRAPSGRQPGPVFEHRTATGWEQSRTIRIGNDIYQTTTTEPGDWALVQPASDSGGGGGGGGGAATVMLLVLAGVVVLIAASIMAIRVRRTRSAAH